MWAMLLKFIRGKNYNHYKAQFRKADFDARCWHLEQSRKGKRGNQKK